MATTATTPHLGYSSGHATTGPPPPYTAVLRKVYPYSMRPVLLISTFISFLYLVIIAIASFRSTAWDHETTKLRLFDVLIGALLIPAACIEALGFMAAWTCRFPLAKLYSLLSIVALGLAVTADVLAIVQHYTLKTDLVEGCVLDNVGRTGNADVGWVGWFGSSGSSDNGGDTSTPWTQDQATKYCNDSWKREGLWAIIWLIIIIFIGLLFLSFAFSFVHQLRNPNSIRNSRNNNNNAHSHQYTSAAFTYDDESAPFDRTAATRYSMDGEHHQQQHAYPPPPGMPPVYHDDHRGGAYDLDAKDPNLASPSLGHRDDDDYYHYNDHNLTRAESSRSAANRQRRSSQDTLTDLKEDQQHLDKTPQI